MNLFGISFTDNLFQGTFEKLKFWQNQKKKEITNLLNVSK